MLKRFHFHQVSSVVKLKMYDNAHFWRYMDVYEVIVHYITNHLDPTNYVLNFGIIALHETRPKVIIRFTLKNTRNNMKESWTQLLEGETLEDLFDSVYETVESNKLEVW